MGAARVLSPAGRSHGRLVECYKTLQAGGVSQDLARMLAGADFLVCRRDLALLIDQVTDPAGVTGFDVGAGAISQPHLAVGVTQQFERKIEFFGKCGVLGDRVEADPENGDVVLFEIGK
jgi:hypothetical protein